MEFFGAESLRPEVPAAERLVDRRGQDELPKRGVAVSHEPDRDDVRGQACVGVPTGRIPRIARIGCRQQRDRLRSRGFMSDCRQMVADNRLEQAV